MSLGDFRLSDTVNFDFTTTQSGVPTTLSGTPVVKCLAGSSGTPVTGGITLTPDFTVSASPVTGLNHVTIVASGANGYATATDYRVIITAGTVGGVSVVGYVVEDFSIEHRSALMPTTPARTAVVDAAGLIDANMVKAGASGSGNAITTSGGVTFPAATLASTTNITAATGIDATKILGTAISTPATAGILDVNVKNMNNVAATPITTIKAVQGLTTADTIATYTGNTPQTGDSFALLNGSNTELAAVPASTVNLVGMIKWLFILARNRVTQTATTQLLLANDDATTVGTSAVSDDTVTNVRGKYS